MKKEHSNGATASYYEIPAGATQLQDLISDRDMNAQIGEVFRACYRYGRVSHSDKIRDAKKILFYAQAEVKRLEMLAEEMLTPANPVAADPLSMNVVLDDGRGCLNCRFPAHSSSRVCGDCDNGSNWKSRISAAERAAPAGPVPVVVAVKSSVAPSRNCETCGNAGPISCGLCDSSYSHWSPR